MGILRVNQISGDETQLSTLGIGTTTPVTGSVFFDGTGDFLDLSSPEFAIGNADFTIECWYRLSSYPTNYYIFDLHTGGNGMRFQLYNGGSGDNVTTYWITSTGTYYASAVNQFVKLDRWYHIAMTRKGTTVYAFMDGILQGTFTVADNFAHTSLRIGCYGAGTSQGFNGYISNFRILKGTALYTANFTPPTLILEPIQDTVLLCCNNPDSAAAVSLAGIGTSKTITVNGNAVASTFNPGLVRNFTSGTQFSGVTRLDTQGYFVPPSGTTENRFPNFVGADAASARGLFGGSYTYGPSSRPSSNVIDYITISSAGNAIDFGDLTLSRGTGGSCASSVRGVFGGGNTGAPTSPGSNNTIDYVTISSSGNAQDFGDLTATREHGVGSCSSSTRGLFGGGTTPLSNIIDYITIFSTGNAQDFGDLTVARYGVASFSSQVRGIFAGSDLGPAYTNVIDFITIATTGNAVDFGDLTYKPSTSSPGGLSNSTRGLIAGGTGAGTNENIIEYITISSLGNSVTFGNLTTNDERRFPGGAASSTRGVFAGGYGGGPTYTTTNTIDYVTISTQGDAVDFGDLTTSRATNGGLSNGHGGLG